MRARIPSVGQARLILPVRDQASPNYGLWGHAGDRGGNPLACACGRRGPPRYGLQGCLRFTVGRGPVPRHASVEETALVGGWFSRRSTLAGDRPPRDGEKKRADYRRARACPSPCLGREGNGLGRRAVFA